MLEKPLIFNAKNKVPRGTSFIDILPQAVKELFFVENPHVKKDSPSAAEKLENFAKKAKIKKIWIYYPWKCLAVCAPEEKVYFKLRTARNRDLITPEEQRNYRKCVVGIAGLSVGSSALSALVMCGGPKTIKIADHDTIDITNLNRIRAKLFDVGKNKADIAAREVWELDPFADVRIYREGLQKNNIRQFIGGKPRLSVFVDEMDDVNMKIESRLICREFGIPVVMATDNGDGAIVDVERFDLERRRPIFHGKIPSSSLNKKLDAAEKMKMVIKVIDPAYFTERQQNSISNIGSTLAGVAQIGTAAAIAGAAIAYAVRLIAAGQKLPSGRYVIKPEEIFEKEYNSVARKKKRAAMTRKFKKSFGL